MVRRGFVTHVGRESRRPSTGQANVRQYREQRDAVAPLNVDRVMHIIICRSRTLYGFNGMANAVDALGLRNEGVTSKQLEAVLEELVGQQKIKLHTNEGKLCRIEVLGDSGPSAA
jgi:hypothetical protein